MVTKLNTLKVREKIVDEIASALWVPGVGIGFCVMLWASVKSKHNRVLASTSTISLLVSIGLFNFVPDLLDHSVLRVVCYMALLVFLITAVAWLLLDVFPIFKRIFNKVSG